MVLQALPSSMSRPVETSALQSPPGISSRSRVAMPRKTRSGEKCSPNNADEHEMSDSDLLYRALHPGSLAEMQGKWWKGRAIHPGSLSEMPGNWWIGSLIFFVIHRALYPGSLAEMQGNWWRGRAIYPGSLAEMPGN